MRFSANLIKTLCGSVHDHPSLVAFLFFLIFLYRTLPFVFSLLISASPILICTAVLLGTILSLGQPNLPEIEKEPRKKETAIFGTEISSDASVIERVESSVAEGSLVENSDAETARSRENEVRKVENVIEAADSKPANSVDEDRGFQDRGFDSDEEWEKERADDKLIEDDRNLASDDGWSVDVMIDDPEGEQLDIFTVSPRGATRHEQADEEGGNGVDSLDTWSNCAESSSPAAYMTDFIPKLNERHPSSQIEPPQPSAISHRGSDSDLEGPDRESDEGKEPDIIGEGNGEEGDNENDDEDAKEEDIKGDEEDGTEAAIESTEDDEKNLMYPGTFEVERNRRLESLIARRRSQKNIRSMAEGNLIHLHCADDIPFNITPISTARHNPFDFSRESYDDMGLPPCPGSAPSILMPRRNPFDLPYEPNEEKPDLKADGFQEEFPFLHQKESVFKRYESFSAKPSRFAASSRQDTQDLRLRPFLALEILANERASYYTFDRQVSEVSESRISSVPDTESVSSWLEEDKKVNTQDAHQGNELKSLEDTLSDSDEQKNLSLEDVDPVNVTKQSDNRNDPHDMVNIALNGAEPRHEEGLSISEAAETRYSDRLLTDIEEKMTDIPKEEVSRSLEQRFEKVEESGEPAQPSYEESQSNSASLIETANDRVSSGIVATDPLVISTVEESSSTEVVEPVSVSATCSLRLDTENDRQEIIKLVQDEVKIPVSVNAVSPDSLSEVTSPTELDKELLWPDKSIAEASSGDQSEIQDLNQSPTLHGSPVRLEVTHSKAHEVTEVDGGLRNELDMMEKFSVEEDKVISEPESSRRDSYGLEGNTENLPVAEAIWVEDISSASTRMHEGTVLEVVCLPGTVKDQLAENSGDTKSKIAVEEVNHALEQLS